MTTTLAELLKDSAYRLTQFKPAQIQALEAAITLKNSGEKSESKPGSCRRLE